MNLLRCARLAGLLAPLWLVTACDGPSEAELITSAQQSLAKKDPKAAVISLKTALQKNAESAQTRFLLGKALLDSGDPGPAAVELSKARELGQPDTDVLPLLVRAMTYSGQAEQATNRFAKTAFDDKAAMAALKVEVAVAWGAQGKRGAMQEAVKQALEADPNHSTAKIMGARYTAERGQFDEAMKAAEEVIARDPGHASAWQLKGLLLGQVRSDADGALAAFRKALELEPSMFSAHAHILAILYSQQDKKGMREQIAALTKALPDAPGTFLFRAQMEYLDGNLKLARELVQQVLRADDPGARALMLAATIEYQAGSLALVERHLGTVLQKEPRHEQARRLLAATLIRSGQPAKALAALQPLLDTPAPSAEVLGLAAETFLNSGDASKAEAYFQRAAKIKPDDPHLRSAIALNRIAKGQTQGGFAELESVAVSDRSTFADLALISAHMKRREFDAALKAVDRLEKKLPDKPLPADLRGRIFLQRMDWPAARTSFEQALKLDPSYFPGAVSLAALDIKDKNLDQAKKRFDALLKLDPNNFSALLALADLKARNKEPREQVTALYDQAVKSNVQQLQPRVALVEHYLATNEYKSAITAAQEGLAAFPENTQILDALARAQLASQEYQQAITSFRKVAILLPESPKPHLWMAEAYWAKKEPEAAVQSLKRALELSPGLPQAQLRRVDFAMEMKNYAEALAVSRQIQKAQPRDGIGFGLEANVHMEQKKWDEAAAALRASMERNPSSEAAVKLHGVLLVAGKRAEADKLEATWLTRWPGDAIFLFHLGDIAMSRQEWAIAEQHYRKVIDLQPRYALAHNNVAWLLIEQKKPGALPFAQKGNELLPNTPRVMDTLAAALSADGQVAKALELQKMALAMDPSSPLLSLGLARIAIKAGDKALAKTELEKLAYLGDKFPAQAEVNQLLRTLQ